MAWFWEVMMGVVLFDVAFVSVALLRSLILERNATSLPEERQGQSLPQESILRFLETLSLAEDEEPAYQTASQKG